ncbi:NirD/YgiW/YdeI family stress tolerance protein [Aquincola sp. MAHUQ-54]|uniref:NirD/YgiW/YdeI family stress tolerance protein n=1 Tax=Aquincola agrisoli TaxID=3119538 RepID=A0AAW9Q6A6_9BURK
MKAKFGKILATAAAGLLLAAPAVMHAQYVGPSASPELRQVAAVLKEGRDDQRVRLQGVLVRHLGSDKYLFSDGSGQIRVEIDDHVFPQAQVSETTRLEIQGEVEKDFLESPEIDVERVVLLSAAPGAAAPASAPAR